MFIEKLHKKLALVLKEKGFDTPKDLQQKCISKINSGADIIAIAPEGTGKSTLINMCAIHKLQYAIEDVPRAIIIVSNKEKAIAMKEQFDTFSKETDLRSVCVFEEGKIDAQSIEVYEGTDVVIGTAKRVYELYFNHSLNLNKLKLFIIDDAEQIIKNAWQSPIDRIGESLPKCQHLIFTNDFNPKIEKLVSKFMVAPQVFESN
ncbi:MAG: DEAD/DEAH box helicase [Bacteroidota bacterium]|nr:DEAD/DEAH box helicase [Bacteroidota bacterium]